MACILRSAPSASDPIVGPSTAPIPAIESSAPESCEAMIDGIRSAWVDSSNHVGFVDVEHGLESASETRTPMTATSASEVDNVCSAGIAESREVRKKAQRRRMRRCFLLVILPFLFLLVLLVIFRPREPHWRLKRLDIDTAEVAGVVLGLNHNATKINFTAEVTFYNPNYIGSTMEPGTFVVSLEDHVLAKGTTEGGSVAARSSADVHTTISMALDEAMSAKILDILMKNKFKLKVSADVIDSAVVFGFIKVTAKVKCDIVSDAMKVLSTPEETIIGQSCSYHYGL